MPDVNTKSFGAEIAHNVVRGSYTQFPIQKKLQGASQDAELEFRLGRPPDEEQARKLVKLAGLF